mgnify:CR=1 FL=1
MEVVWIVVASAALRLVILQYLVNVSERLRLVLLTLGLLLSGVLRRSTQSHVVRGDEEDYGDEALDAEYKEHLDNHCLVRLHDCFLIVVFL